MTVVSFIGNDLRATELTTTMHAVAVSTGAQYVVRWRHHQVGAAAEVQHQRGHQPVGVLQRHAVRHRSNDPVVPAGGWTRLVPSLPRQLRPQRAPGKPRRRGS